MSINEIPNLPLVERLRIVPLAEAARLSGISEDGLRRHHSDKLIKLSPRRIGIGRATRSCSPPATPPPERKRRP